MVVPRIGGRLMQVTFGGHDYLFVNDELKGRDLPRIDVPASVTLTDGTLSSLEQQAAIRAAFALH
jgi:hypothetical protein